MHRPPCARSSGRSKARPLPRCAGTAACALRSRTLKDWSAACRCPRCRWGSRVDRSWSRLRHNHASGRWPCRSRGSCRWSCFHRGRRFGFWRGHRRRGGRNGNGNRLCGSRNRGRCRGSRRRRSYGCYRWHNHRLGCGCGHSCGRYRHRTVGGRSNRGRRRCRRNHRRTRNHRSNRWLTRDGGLRCRCRCNDVCSLARQGNDPARSRGGTCRRLRGRRLSRNGLAGLTGWRNRGGHSRPRSRRCHGDTARRCRGHCRSRRRRGRTSGCLCLSPLQNRLQGVTRLRCLRQVNLGNRSRLTAAAAVRRQPSAAVDVAANLLRLIFLDRAGVRLARNADRLQSIQNRSALYFKLSCQIVDSNFTHPPLFASLRP